MPTPLETFLEQGGARPYRDLIEYHVNKSSVGSLMEEVASEAELLSRALGIDGLAFAERFINKLNSGLLPPQPFAAVFWGADCSYAFDLIMGIAATYIDGELQQILESMIGFRLQPAQEDELQAKHQDMAFAVFQIATLQFAYQASIEPNFRNFLRINK